jgi:hypothetical protein
MERRTAVATVALVLSMVALAAVGSFIASSPAPSEAAGLPQPAPALMPEQPQTSSVLPGGGAVAFAPGGMSGDFAPRLLADAGALRAPSIYIPSDGWRFRLPGARASDHRAPDPGSTAVRYAA